MISPPYGATPPDVRNIVMDVAAEGLRLNQRAPRASDEVVEGWIVQAGAVVALRLARLALLPADSTDVDGGYEVGVPTQVSIEPFARHLVELYAASLLADVTHPEVAQNGRGFGDVLMRRYEAAATSLATQIDVAVERLGTLTGADASFPQPFGIGTDRTSGIAGFPGSFTRYGYPAGRGF